MTCTYHASHSTEVHHGITVEARFKHRQTTRLPEDHSYPHTNIPYDFCLDLMALLKARIPHSYMLEIGSFKGDWWCRKLTPTGCSMTATT